MTNKFKWFEKPLRLVNILLISLTLLTYLVSNINPNVVGWLSVLGLTYPALVIFNTLFLVFWLYRQKYYLAVSTFICILLGWNSLTASYGIHHLTSKPDLSQIENKLTVGTYNVRNFRISGQWDKDTRDEKLRQTLAFVQNTQPDIFCGQEFSYPVQDEKINGEIKRLLNNSPHIATNKKGLLISSKYPIINSEEVHTSDEKKDYACLFADVRINNSIIVRVYNLYLASNKVSKTTETMAFDTEKLQEKSTWRTIYNVLGSIKNNQKLRAIQIKNITEHIKGSPYPVILCGDFNDPPVSYTFQKANALLQDNFAKKGKGKGKTYNGNIPFLRIDYILSDRRFNVLETRIAREYSTSDHFPIISTVSWEM